MKKITISIFIVTLLFSCQKNFLDQYPKDQLTEQTAFITYDNFKTYAWSLYDIFESNTHVQYISTGDAEGCLYNGDFLSGLLQNKSKTRNPWAWQLITPETAGGWDFSFIRKTNIMLDKIDQTSMSDADKRHWRSVGLFFRSYHYMELLARFGDVPWLEHVVTESDVNVIYGGRTARDTVAANILRDLQFAENNIKTVGEGAGTNTINQTVVRALLSRFALFEGTWRKYHGLAGSDTYLQECKRVSKLLIDANTTIAPAYQALWSSEELKSVPGVFLYKEYVANILMQPFSRFERGGSQKTEMHARTLERYLCRDGKTIYNSPQYQGDANMNDEFRNRDLRLYYRVIPPYKVSGPLNGTTWSYTADPRDREYIDTMNNLDKSGLRNFPVLSWQPFVILNSPNIQGATINQAPVSCNTGYYFYMFYNTGTNVTGGANFSTTDVPLFHIEETMLNYAEAMYELGQFDQQVADLTINKLRARAKVAPMQVATIDAAFDPSRDPSVAPLLWEIRRERMVELMGEGFSFHDVRRWKKAAYFVNQQPLGARLPANWQNGLPSSLKLIATGKDAGRCYAWDDPVAAGKGWLDKYYLYPIPTTQISLNPNIEQNPGW
ncbi:RagB/SusD family nutrient uptake outer membrane protein [Niabella sp.]|uniref:RagB/SusD family nutrient uptake outer membrane protein n=1 Tax=Niabella sp. TaxID=1962976 RepID=UPI002631366E|nr:RagB/SusD family nutrient uptake outer membrane protein [Niabella sp.]